MFDSVRRITGPAFEFATLTAVKRNLGIDEADTTHDLFLADIIPAARVMIEARASTTLTPTKWRGKFDTWPAYCFGVEIPNPPLLYDPVSYPIEIVFANGTVVDPADMTIDTDSFPGRVGLSVTGYSVCGGARGTITWWAGRETLAEIEPAYVKAGLMLVGHLFENREATTTEGLRALPMGVETLLASVAYSGMY
jgi:uncharacterized phiE125 gp8 family phage protein